MSRLLSLTALAVCLFAAGSAEGFVPLWARRDITGIVNIRTVAAADFNGDGRPDLVVRITSPKLIELVLTNENVTFPWSTTTIYTHTSATDLAVGDIDGDGDQDVVVAETDGRLVALRSNNDGTFAAAITTTTALTAPRFASADFTGDGKADLIVRSGSTAALYVSDGAGNFTLHASRTLSGPSSAVEAADVDNDGKADYILGFSDATPYEVSFGNGDGTFAAPVTLSGITSNPFRIATGDLDADGDRDLVIPHFGANTFSVVVNAGGRSFAGAVVYGALPQPVTTGNPIDAFIADVNDDGDADVVMTLSNERLLGTFPGNGDGTFDPGVYVEAGSAPPGVASYPLYLAPADFTGDGQVDLALAGMVSLAIWENVAGDISLRLSGGPHPTLSAGQTARFTVYAEHAQVQFMAPTAPPAVTGTVTLRANGVDLASSPLVGGRAELETDSLPAGTHQVTAHYSGNEAYRPAVSAPVEQRVIAASTIVTVDFQDGRQVQHGEQFQVGFVVTRSDGVSVSGPGVHLYIDGVLESTSGWAPQDGFPVWEPLAIGSHTLVVRYEGSESHPPASSEPVTVVVTKAATVTIIDYDNVSIVIRYGAQSTLPVVVHAHPYGSTPTGTVRMYDGATLITTVAAGSANVPIVLSPGMHRLRAVYGGDDNHQASSAAIHYFVAPAAGFVMQAWLVNSTIVAEGVYDLPPGGHFRLYRRVGTGGWDAYDSSHPRRLEQNPQPGVPYTFRMEAYDANNQLVAWSNTDVVMRASVTNDPIGNGTVIKAAHVAELVSAANTLRAAAGLGPISIAGTSPGDAVRASHFEQLRAAINEARAAFGADAAPFSGGAGIIRARDMQELRDAIR